MWNTGQITELKGSLYPMPAKQLELQLAQNMETGEVLESHSRKSFMLLIDSFRVYFRPRLSEWFMASWAILWGCYVVLHPEVFTNGATKDILGGLSTIAEYTTFPPAALWGLAAVWIGMIRAVALFINGQYSRTPVVRLVTSMLSGGLLLAIVIGMLIAGLPSLSVPTYLALLSLDILCAYFAACDIPLAERNRQEAKENSRAGSNGRT